MSAIGEFAEACDGADKKAHHQGRLAEQREIIGMLNAGRDPINRDFINHLISAIKDTTPSVEDTNEEREVWKI